MQDKSCSPRHRGLRGNTQSAVRLTAGVQSFPQHHTSENASHKQKPLQVASVSSSIALVKVNIKFQNTWWRKELLQAPQCLSSKLLTLFNLLASCCSRKQTGNTCPNQGQVKPIPSSDAAWLAWSRASSDTSSLRPPTTLHQECQCLRHLHLHWNIYTSEN